MNHLPVQRKKNLKSLILLTLLLIASGVSGQSKNTIHQYIDTWSPVAMEEMRRHGIPASIKLAQGILESGNGNSLLARNANNHFGIKCHGWAGATFHKDDDLRNECFRAYRDASESFSDHSAFLTSRGRYSSLFELDVMDYKAWARGLRQAGYATNPRYPELLISIIERNDLTRYDRMAMQVVAEQTKPLVSRTREVSAGAPSGEEIFPVPLSGPRQQLTNNRIRYVRARPGDTPASVAEELDMYTWQIIRYNDLDEDRSIVPGQIIYLQPKRRRGAFPHHLVQSGETMYDISQKYGIRLSQLYRRNKMEKGMEPHAGQQLLLRGRAR